MRLAALPALAILIGTVAGCARGESASPAALVSSSMASASSFIGPSASAAPGAGPVAVSQPGTVTMSETGPGEAVKATVKTTLTAAAIFGATTTVEATPTAAAESPPQTFTFDDWVAFFAALAGLSATIFSVMFITFQVRSELWKDSRLRRAVATSALGELLVALFVSLISLMAGNPWRAAAMVAGGFGVIVILTHWYFFILERDAAKPFDHAQAKAAWFSFALYTTIFICGLLDPKPGLYIIASISTWLLFSGAGEAFLLLAFREDLHGTEKKRFAEAFTAWAGDTISSMRKLADWRILNR